MIATTSTAAKAAKLKALGADHVINYTEEKCWGDTVKRLTGGIGAQFIIEVGGLVTMEQSLRAIALEGVIGVIGFIGGGGAKSGRPPTLLDALTYQCIVRGIYVGSRVLFEEMNRAIEANDIKPVIDDKIFPLEDVKAAYQYQWDQKHIGKIVIAID